MRGHGENDADVLILRIIVDAAVDIDVGAGDERDFAADGDVGFLIIAGEDVRPGKDVELVLLGEGLERDGGVALEKRGDESAGGCGRSGGSGGAERAGEDLSLSGRIAIGVEDGEIRSEIQAVDMRHLGDDEP